VADMLHLHKGAAGLAAGANAGRDKARKTLA
jgi:hypothetical protein